MLKQTLAFSMLLLIVTSAPAIPKPVMDLFKHIDADGSGDISKEEAVKFAGQLGTDGKQAEADFAQIDADGNGSVSLEEFVDAIKEEIEKEAGGEEYKPSPEEIAAAFKLADANGDGGLSLAEGKAAFEAHMGFPPPEGVCEEVHKLMDVNKDGNVTLEEMKATHDQVKKEIEKFLGSSSSEEK